MPFDFKAYDAKCAGLNAEELQKEWNHYTRLISGGATSTAISGLAIPLTAGVSSIGVALAAPGIHNARKKRDIIERHLQRHGTTHETRKRDVLGSMAFSGTVGVVTLGAGSLGAESIMTNGAEHGMVLCETGVKVATHVVGDAVGMGVEHLHTDHKKKKDMRKLFEKSGTFQAVADAKAAEAGYSIDGQAQTVQGQQYYGSVAGPSGAVVAGAAGVAVVGGVMMPPPPPLYAPHDPLQPISPPPSYGIAEQQRGTQQQYVMATGDSKAPMVYVAAPQQPFDPYAQYYQQTEASVASGVVMTPTAGSAGVAMQEQYGYQQQYPPQHQSMGLVWDDEKGQYQQAMVPQGQVSREQSVVQVPAQSSDHGPAARQSLMKDGQVIQHPPQASAPAAVFEMGALEQALPVVATATTMASVSQNATGSTDTISTVSTAAVSVSQSAFSTPTRSSTLVSQCSSAYSVESGYCPTPRHSVAYPPPPPQQQGSMPTSTSNQDRDSHSDQAYRPTSVYHPSLQQATEHVSIPSSHTPLPSAQPQFAIPNYNPVHQTQYAPMPSAPSPIPQYQPHRQDTQTEKQERPVSGMYFAPPPEQPKSKRMSIMHSVSSMIDQVKASQGEPAHGNQQQQHDTNSPSAISNPTVTQAEVVPVRPQAVPIQQYHAPQPQYGQQAQYQHQYRQQQPPIAMPMGAHMPPTPLSPPFTPSATGQISAQHTGSQYQTYQPPQQQQTVTGGYFPPPPPGGPPPSSQTPQQYLPQKAAEPYGYNNGYPQQMQGGMLTPMATPGSSSGQQFYQGQAQPQYYQSA